MPDAQIGNLWGVAANGNNPTLLTGISADGANTVTVTDITKVRSLVGLNIDIVNITTGAVLAAARTVQGLTSAGVLTYSGADVTAVAGTHGVYPAGEYAPTGAANINGGNTAQKGDVIHFAGTNQAMMDRLTLLAPSTFTAARLATMTTNDLLYALRLLDQPATVR